MGWFLVVAAVGAVLFYFLQRSSKGTRNPSLIPGPSPATATAKATKASREDSLLADIAFLRTQWAIADKEKASGAPSTFPNWFFDKPSDKQLARLKESVIDVYDGDLTKGAASDLIGLTEPVEEADTEPLQFFKVPTRGLNQTRARYELKRLMADPVNILAWETRPASAMQIECLRFFGMTVPKDVTYEDAVQIISDHFAELADTDSKRAVEWDSFESVVEDLNDKENREDHGIKKPTLAAIRQAFDAVLAGGIAADDIDGSLVAEKLLEMKPELALE